MLITPPKLIGCIVKHFKKSLDGEIEDITRNPMTISPAYCVIRYLSGTIQKHRMVYTVKDGVTCDQAKDMMFYFYKRVASWCVHSQQTATISRKGNSAIVRFKPKRQPV